MEFPKEIINQIHQLHHVAKAEVVHLKVKTEEAAQTENVWVNLKDFLDKGWTLCILDLLEKEAPRLKKMRSENNPAISNIEELYRITKNESDRILRRYPALLEDACRKSGIALDSNSRHPRYSLEHGFFQLEIDEERRLARLSDYEGRLAEHPADIEVVLETIQREHLRIFGRPFNGQQFLKMLRSHYKSILNKEKRGDGDSLPIRHITRRLGKNIKHFRTDEFLLDLSKLAEQGPFEIDGRRLDLQQTKDINQGMLLHGTATRGYIGFIVFKEL